MSEIAPILPLVSPLGDKLGSDHDGEIIVVVRQFRRVLADEGLSFNDLARALHPQPERVIYLEAEPPEPRTWSEMARWVAHHDGGRLHPHERKFAEDMARRLVMLGQPTEQQVTWLRSLFAKVGGEAQ